MNIKTIEAVVALGRRVGHVWIATADSDGLPHLAAAGELFQESENRISLSSWFCPGTVENVKKNPRVSVVSWDAGNDSGYQLLGTVEAVQELAMMDGYSSEVEKRGVLPQVERKLVVRVDKIIAFSRAPHSDVEE